MRRAAPLVVSRVDGSFCCCASCAGHEGDTGLRDRIGPPLGASALRVRLRHAPWPTVSMSPDQPSGRLLVRGWIDTMIINLAGVSPAPSAIRVGTTPPTAPPTPPTTPPSGTSTSLVVDLTEASRLTARAVEMLGTVPQDDVGAESTKDLRIRIHKTNLAAQKRLEQQFEANGNDAGTVSALRQADAFLEDSNWQIARKPSPDGRFNGVDIPGALRDANEAARVISDLLTAAGGTPTSPATPPPGGVPMPPPGVPPMPPTGGIPTPPSGGGSLPGTPPTGGIPTPPSGGGSVPGTPPTGGIPTPPSGGGTPDPDYPGEDEFPTDDKVLGGGDN